jgi:hypothetical protein
MPRASGRALIDLRVMRTIVGVELTRPIPVNGRTPSSVQRREHATLYSWAMARDTKCDGEQVGVLPRVFEEIRGVATERCCVVLSK